MQPNCPSTPGKLLGAIFYGITDNSEGIDLTAACNHFSAVYLYIDTIKNGKNCKFTGYQCSSFDDFNYGKCLKCSSKGCNIMGYYSSPSKDLGTLYLNTKEATKPFSCKQNYLLNLYSSSSNKLSQIKGKFSIFFMTSVQNSSIVNFDESTFKPGTAKTRLISLNEPLDENYPIESAYIIFKKENDFSTEWKNDSFWSFDYIEILNGPTQTLFNLCPNKETYQSNLIEFKNCTHNFWLNQYSSNSNKLSPAKGKLIHFIKIALHVFIFSNLIR